MERRFLKTLSYAHGHDNQGLDEIRARETSCDHASRELREKIEAYFASWEQRYGFRPGAGRILVPAGYVPNGKPFLLRKVA